MIIVPKMYGEMTLKPDYFVNIEPLESWYLNTKYKTLQKRVQRCRRLG